MMLMGSLSPALCFRFLMIGAFAALSMESPFILFTWKLKGLATDEQS